MDSPAGAASLKKAALSDCFFIFGGELGIRTLGTFVHSISSAVYVFRFAAKPFRFIPVCMLQRAPEIKAFCEKEGRGETK